jgi:hypothetical protein
MRSQTRRGARGEVGLEEGQRVGRPRAVWTPEVSNQRRSAETGGVRLDGSLTYALLEINGDQDPVEANSTLGSQSLRSSSAEHGLRAHNDPTSGMWEGILGQ